MCEKNTISLDAFYFKTNVTQTNHIFVFNVHKSTLINQVFHNVIVPILSCQMKWSYLCTKQWFKIRVDEMGVDKMGVDKIGVDQMGVDEMGTHR